MPLHVRLILILFPQGMVFMITVVDAPPGHVASQIPVPFTLTYNLYPPMTIFKGDSLFFFW